MRQVNLLPEEIQQNEKVKIIRNSFCLTIFPIILGMALLHSWTAARLSELEQTARSPQTQQESVQIQRIHQETAILQSRAQELVSRDKNLIEFFVVNFPLSEFLKKVGNSAVEKVWLTKFAVDMPKGTCDIDGRSLNTRLVSEFILALKQLPYFNNVTLLMMGEDQKEKKPGEIYFKIICRIK